MCFWNEFVFLGFKGIGVSFGVGYDFKGWKMWTEDCFYQCGPKLGGSVGF